MTVKARTARHLTEDNIMKTKIITTLLCASLISPSMAGDAWDITRDTLYTKKATHVWENLDGSKTYRYDTPSRTTFDTRTAQSVAAEAQFKQQVVVFAVVAIVAGVSAFCEWLNSPSSTTVSR